MSYEKYFKGDGWTEYPTLAYKRATEHLGNAVKRPQEWDGSGLPPVGTECEYYLSRGDEWRRCDVVGCYLANVVAIDVFDIYAVFLPTGLFRPIKTPEQIAAEERLHAIDEMVSVGNRRSTALKKVMSALYDAGYRKTEVKK